MDRRSSITQRPGGTENKKIESHRFGSRMDYMGSPSNEYSDSEDAERKRTGPIDGELGLPLTVRTCENAKTDRRDGDPYITAPGS